MVGSESVAVDKQCFGANRQLVDGAVHGCYRRLEDIDFIDFFGRNESHSPGKSFALYDGAQLVALAFGELLRVVEKFVLKVGRQNHSSGCDGSCQTAAACLVASCFDNPWG